LTLLWLLNCFKGIFAYDVRHAVIALLPGKRNEKEAEGML
jgi:hypothetical protein